MLSFVREGGDDAPVSHRLNVIRRDNPLRGWSFTPGRRQLVLNLVLWTCLSGCDRPSRPGHTFDAGPHFRRLMSSELTHTFKVKNTTGRSVKILKKISSCSCASAELERDTLAPGEETTLTLRTGVQDASNGWEIACRLVTDSPDDGFKDWIYRLHYRSYTRARMEPPTLAFGLVKCDKVRAETVMPQRGIVELMQPASEPPDRIERWDVPDGFELLADPEPEVELIESGRVRRSRFGYALRLKPSANQIPGARSAALALVTRGHAIAVAVISWTSESPWVLEPSSVHLGILQMGESSSKSVILRSSEGESFRILEMLSDSDSVFIEREERGTPALDSKSAHVLRIKYRGQPSPTRALTGLIKIRTDRHNEAIVSIPWSALFH